MPIPVPKETTEGEMEAFLSNLKVSDGNVGAGYMFVRKITLGNFKEQKTKGGLVLPTKTASGEGQHQDGMYCVVEQCSPIYMEHSGHIVEPTNPVYENWPLKKGQIVALRNTV